MATISEIPLIPAPQILRISLSGVTYVLSLKWFAVAGVWLLDISDVNGNSLVAGAPLVTGTDLLLQYRHLGFVGGLWCATDGDPDAAPTFTNLGDTSHLYYVEY